MRNLNLPRQEGRFINVFINLLYLYDQMEKREIKSEHDYLRLPKFTFEKKKKR